MVFSRKGNSFIGVVTNAPKVGTLIYICLISEWVFFACFLCFRSVGSLVLEHSVQGREWQERRFQG